MHYEIHTDEHASSPREDENMGTIMLVSNKYITADYQATLEEVEDKLKDKNCIALPVYAYIHSGISINTTGFQCPWDSGRVGCIFVSREQIREDFKIKRISSKLEVKIRNYLNQEIEIFNNYINGNVYGFIVKDDLNQEIDSCWGFYSREDAERAAEDSMNYFINKVA